MEQCSMQIMWFCYRTVSVSLLSSWYPGCVNWNDNIFQLNRSHATNNDDDATNVLFFFSLWKWKLFDVDTFYFATKNTPISFKIFYFPFVDGPFFAIDAMWSHEIHFSIVKPSCLSVCLACSMSNKIVDFFVFLSLFATVVAIAIWCVEGARSEHRTTIE